jgi:hypothetical protein
MNAVSVSLWVTQQSLSPSDIDCAVAVMLKILDGKCKMNSVEKQVMTCLYDAVKGRAGLKLGDDEHRLIDQARVDASDALRNLIYEKRVLAETAISRPVMKAFKAMIRQQGLFADTTEADDSE